MKYPHEALRVSPSASLTEVKAAYRRLARMYHPDVAMRNGLDPAVAEEKFKACTAAYEVLCDRLNRAAMANEDAAREHSDPTRSSNSDSKEEFEGKHAEAYLWAISRTLPEMVGDFDSPETSELARCWQVLGSAFTSLKCASRRGIGFGDVSTEIESINSCAAILARHPKFARFSLELIPPGRQRDRIERIIRESRDSGRQQRT